MHITTNTISSAIGRPVRMFTSVCKNSRTFDRNILEDSSRIIREHGGSALAVVHPGFYLMDKDRSKLIADLDSTNGEQLLNEQHACHTEKLKQFLSGSHIPLFLFIEENRGIAPYAWIFDHARPDLTLIIETTKGSFLPMIREDTPSELLFWPWTASAIRFDLGVDHIKFTGEYLFVNDGAYSGCVQSAYLALEKHLTGDIDTALTFPNSPRKF